MWRSVWGCEWISAGNGPSRGARSSELWVGLGEAAAEAGTATSDALIKGGPESPTFPRCRRTGAAGAARQAARGQDGAPPTRRSGRNPPRWCAEPEAAGSAGAPRPRPRAPGRRRSSSAFRGVWLLSLPVSPNRHRRRGSRRRESSEPGCGRPGAPGRGRR